VTRRPAGFPLSGAGLTIAEADVETSTQLGEIVSGHDAVISVLGVPYGRKPITVYSHGTANILEAMRLGGVRRLVCVSSTAVDHRYRQGGFFFERVLKPLLSATLGKTTYADQRRMESLVWGSDCDWTIVRPSGLFETGSVSRYSVQEGFEGTRKFTARADLAHCLLAEATGCGHVRSTIAVSTLSPSPSLLRLIVREAFHRDTAPLQPAGSAG
jgi:nucleoside-diphosphate-sugar epimerase